MGRYIQGPALGKAGYLQDRFAAVEVAKPDSLSEFEDDRALVVVVSNGPFEAAAYVYSEGELQEFARPLDTRPKTWLLMDKKVAEAESGF